MVKLKAGNILKEQYYEVVNNVKVLQPRYMQIRDKNLFEKNLHEFMKKRNSKKIAESYVFQKGLIE